MTIVPFVPFHTNAPKKVSLPLMKARKGPESEGEIDGDIFT